MKKVIAKGSFIVRYCIIYHHNFPTVILFPGRPQSGYVTRRWKKFTHFLLLKLDDPDRSRSAASFGVASAAFNNNNYKHNNNTKWHSWSTHYQRYASNNNHHNTTFRNSGISKRQQHSSSYSTDNYLSDSNVVLHWAWIQFALSIFYSIN